MLNIIEMCDVTILCRCEAGGGGEGPEQKTK